MDTVKKVEILIKEIPNITRRGVLSTEPLETKLLVVSFDTAAVHRISQRRQDEGGTDERLVLPAKYAALWHEGRDDIGIIAQSLVMFDRYRNEAVWFDTFRDLPFAVDELRKKFPDKDIPDSVTCLIDWPFDRRKLQPGETLVSSNTNLLEKA